VIFLTLNVKIVKVVRECAVQWRGGVKNIEGVQKAWTGTGEGAGVTPYCCEVREYTPGKMFENVRLRCCILVRFR